MEHEDLPGLTCPVRDESRRDALMSIRALEFKVTAAGYVKTMIFSISPIEVFVTEILEKT